ncbi:MAG: inositol monophosphatase family protein [Cyanobacteria bacterium P01_A01_bin.135]
MLLTDPSATTRTEFLAFARELAAQAEAAIMPHFQEHAVSYKADGSEVTIADREGEAVMRRLIGDRYPDHAILGEEHGQSGPEGARYCWVLDPIDGTAWFTLGVPLFGTLVALLEDGEPIVGVIHLPGLQETVYAAKGSGCWFVRRGSDPTQVHVSAVPRLPEAIASATGVHSSDIQCHGEELPYRLTQLIHRVRKFRFCSDCNQHALVSRGKLQVAVDTLMNPWDVAALVPCIEEAGGKVTNLAGQRKNIVFGGSLLSTCGEPLHQTVLDLLQPAAESQWI